MNPRDLYRPGDLDVLWASPECTHHSVARGGKPIHEQSRATAWCVIRWADALLPPVILVENVPEFVTWGPLDSKHRPIKHRKGEIFRAWIKNLEALGYRVEWRVLCAADYGDPTTRRRLFVQAVRGRRKIIWPEPTHAPTGDEDLLGLRLPWRSAREIIDWEINAASIYDRKRPLSPKTMARIYAGLRKFGLRSFTMSAGGPACPARPVDQPLGTVLTRDHRAVVEPYLVQTAHGNDDATGNERRTHPLDDPLGAVSCTNDVGLVEPFIVPNFGEREGQVPRSHSVNEPLPAVTGHGAGALVEPFLIPQHGSHPARSLDQPAPTVTTTSRGIGLAEPFLICMEHKGSVRSIERPVPTITTAKGGAIGVAEPFLVKMRGTSEEQVEKHSAGSLDDPAPTITSGGGHLGLAEPFLVQVNHQGGDRGRSVNDPLPTVCGNRGEFGVCEPSLLPQNAGGALRLVSEPAPTVATKGAIGLVEPFLIEYYGTAGAQSVDEPLDTVTTKDRHALVRPEVTIKGQRYLLDIRFRMLQPHELAAAQGFRKGYRFSGNKTEQVKQIGNGVPRHLSRAIFAAVTTQNSDVAWLWK